jgi:transcriptional regulator with XRE-family HTH domain
VTQDSPQREPTHAVAQRVKELLRKRGLTGEMLADRMTELDIPWNRAIVANLVSGRRRTVSVDELLALAVVLNVAPVHLLVPPDDPHAAYEVTPKVTAERSSVRAWIRGVNSIDADADWRQFFAEVPKDEFYAVQQGRPRTADEPYGVRPEDGDGTD